MNHFYTYEKIRGGRRHATTTGHILRLPLNEIHKILKCCCVMRRAKKSDFAQQNKMHQKCG